MSKGRPTDVAASVRGRLQKQSKEMARPFEELMQYFAMERLLYRLAKSPYADKFVLKGALLLQAWQASAFRPTKDIDLLGRVPNDVGSIAAIFKEVCAQTVEEDGVDFDPDSIQGRVIKEDADYEGVRITFVGYLQKSRLSMQIDVGFGDVIVPEPILSLYPTLLDFAAPQLYHYPRETAVAEKFEAMVKLEELNSRMKDFYDIWSLSRQFDFDGKALSEAIRRTFANRGTPVTASPVAWKAEFAANAVKQTQWAGFLRKSRVEDAPVRFVEVVEGVSAFLQPPAMAIELGARFEMRWSPPGPWQ